MLYSQLPIILFLHATPGCTPYAYIMYMCTHCTLLCIALEVGCRVQAAKRNLDGVQNQGEIVTGPGYNAGLNYYCRYLGIVDNCWLCFCAGCVITFILSFSHATGCVAGCVNICAADCVSGCAAGCAAGW